MEWPILVTTYKGELAVQGVGDGPKCCPPCHNVGGDVPSPPFQYDFMFGIEWTPSTQHCI